MSEEVEVQVRQIHEEEDTAEAPPVVDVMRRLLLASIGAVAMTYDEVEKLVGRLVDRGELARRDGEKIMNQMMDRFRPAEKAEQAEAEVNQKVEGGIERLLNNLNIPSKRDIDELSARVAQLSARVEEMQRPKSKT